MAFDFSLSVIRTKLANKWNTALSIDDAATRTYYPDRSLFQEAIDKQLAGADDSGNHTVFFVITPGMADNPPREGSCGTYFAHLPVEITYCKRYDDLPHRKGSADLLAHGSNFIEEVLGEPRPWTGSAVSLCKDIHVTQLTTQFPEAEQINNAGYACIRIGLLLSIELS